MLIEVMCDHFLDHGQKRGKISFHPGLNAVLGSESGSNSIGKSTFLMIIDFVFGGNDYVDRLKDVQEEIGPHTICFAFQFGDDVHHFSRSNTECSEVQKCDSHYQPLPDGRLSLSEYRGFLQTHYQMNLPSLTFREAVGRSMRIYKRENLNEEHPLHNVSKEKDEDAVASLLKLFDLYAGLEELAKRVKEANNEKSAIKQAQQYHLIPAVANDTAYKKNESRIAELTAQRDELEHHCTGGLAELEAFQAEQLISLKEELSALKRQRTRIQSQRRAICAGCWEEQQSKPNYKGLLKFFPGANIPHIQAIERFHHQLAEILKKDFAEEDSNIQAALAHIDSQIEQLEAKIAQFPCPSDLPKTVLKQHTALEIEIRQLGTANQNYENSKKLAENAKRCQNELKEQRSERLHSLKLKLNDEMAIINDYIYEGRKTAPTIDLKDKSYTFYTPKDGGTGTQYKGLIVFDLALLSLTCLPVIAHDSVILKQIEDGAIEKILGLYAASPKQVFIALDKASSLTPESQKILHSAKVLQLGGEAGALFGRTWNTKSKSR